MRFSRIFFLPLVVVAAAACNDTTGTIAWSDAPDTVTLYSASRADLLGHPSAFDFTIPSTIVLESATAGSSYDMVLVDQAGAFSLLPSTILLGTYNRAGLAPVIADSLHAIRQAPTDTTQFVTRSPVPIHLGDFFVVRSRQTTCTLTTGSFYGKFQVVAVKPDSGTVRLAIARNPYCGDTSLVPPGS